MITATLGWCVLLLFVAWYFDFERKERLVSVATAFGFGISSVAIAASFEIFFSALFDEFLLIVCVAPIVEEVCKLSSVAYFDGRMDELEDALVYSASVSLGFAFLENVIYIIGYYYELTIQELYTLTILRAILSVPAHIVACGLCATIYVYCRKFLHLETTESIFVSVLPGAVYHGMYNLVAITGNVPLLMAYTGFGLLAYLALWMYLRHLQHGHILPRENIFKL